MKKSRLTNLLSGFERDDWPKFIKFLKSNSIKSNEYLSIVKYIQKQAGKRSIEYFDIDELRQKTGSTLGKQSFANLTSALCKLIEEYFVAQEILHDENLRTNLILRSMAKRGLIDEFYKKKNKIRSSQIDLWSDYHLFQTNHYEYFYNIDKNKYDNGKALRQAFVHFTEFISIQSHFYTLEMHNRQVIVGENWQEEIDQAKQLMTVETHLTAVFDELIKMKINKSESSYLFLKNQILNLDKDISKELRNAIYIHLTSFLNHKIKNGQSERIPELLSLYEIGFERDITNFAGQISIRQFLSIVNTACNLNALKWTKQFVDKWITSIDTHYRNEVLQLSLANILFANKEFGNVLDSLKSLRLKAFDHEYRVRWLQLMSIYEIDPDNTDLIDSKVRNFKYFIQANKNRLERSTFEANINSLTYLLKLVNEKMKPADLEYLKSGFPYIRQQWLIEKSDAVFSRKKA